MESKKLSCKRERREAQMKNQSNFHKIIGFVTTQILTDIYLEISQANLLIHSAQMNSSSPIATPIIFELVAGMECWDSHIR